MSSDRAGQTALPSDLVDVPHLVTAYYTHQPDPADPFELLRWDDLASAEVGGPNRAATAGIDTDMAAILYTSGSTGYPKGVPHRHVSVCQAVMQAALQVERGKMQVARL